MDEIADEKGVQAIPPRREAERILSQSEAVTLGASRRRDSRKSGSPCVTDNPDRCIVVVREIHDNGTPEDKMGHPNPAEVCKSRGWAPGTRLGGDGYGSPMLLCYIGHNYILCEDRDGDPIRILACDDIREWFEMPDVHVASGVCGSFVVMLRDKELFQVHVMEHAVVKFGMGDSRSFASGGADRITEMVKLSLASEGK